MSRDDETIAAYLARSALFSKCTNRELSVAARHAELEEFAPGSTVMTEGDDGDAFYVVIEGTAEVRHAGDVLADLGPGEYFGELALLDPAPRSADVVATSPLVVARLGVAQFRLLLEAVPHMAHQLLAGLAGEVRRASLRSRASAPGMAAETWRW